jgi:hypothetical protein
VENLDRLAKLFDGLTQDNLPALHALGESRADRDKGWERAWGMTKRLGGIRPVILPVDVDASKLKAMTVDQVKQVFDIDEETMALTLSELQLAWQHLLSADDLPSIAEAIPKPAVPAAEVSDAVPSLRVQAPNAPIPQGFSEEEIALLTLATYPTTIFNYHSGQFDKRAEIEWFCERIKEVRKVFEEPMTKALGRNALLNELTLKRINDQLVVINPVDKEFVRLQESKQQIEKTYGDQWKQIEELCPSIMASTTRKQTLSVLADLVRLYRDYKSNPDNVARDGIFTDSEIQILFRRSTQFPEVRYRLGWVLACNDAKRGIGDPNFKRKMSTSLCKLIDTAFAYAANAAADHMKLSKPDLELDGPAGEYPPMHMERDGEVTDPDFTLLEEVAEEQVEISDPNPIS